MPKSKPPNTDAAKRERTERVLDVLDAAVTAEPDLDAPGPATTRSKGLEALPERLRDPFAVLERGRALLRTGLPLRGSEVTTDFDVELRMVARNGKPIPEDVQQRMNGERARREVTVSSTSPTLNPSEDALANAQIRRTAKTRTVAPPTVRREVEIEELAALLVAQSTTKDRVDLESIAVAEGITFSFGHYGDSVDCLLECRNSTFHIYINVDTNKS